MNKWLVYIAITIFICLFAVFIYPTLYIYDKMDQKWPVKINRITGKTEVLNQNGWRVLGKEKEEDLTVSTQVKTTEDQEPYFEKVELESALLDISTKEVELEEGIVISKIHFTDYNVTGEIKNSTNEFMLFSTIKFELFDKDENVLSAQPDSKLISIDSNDSEIFTYFTDNKSSNVGKYRIIFSYTKELNPK